MKFWTIAVGAAALLSSPTASANIFHVIAFRYKAEVTPAQRTDFARRIVALKNSAKRDGRPYIVSVKGGRAISREGYDQRFQQMYVMEFKSTADRDYFVGQPYLPAMDPAHREVVDRLLPSIESDDAGKLTGTFVFDFDDTDPVFATR